MNGIQRVLCWLGRHHFVWHDFRPTGFVTCCLFLIPRMEFAKESRCKHCGAIKSDHGWYVPGHKTKHPEMYDSDGWPIDATGNRMSVTGGSLA